MLPNRVLQNLCRLLHVDIDIFFIININSLLSISLEMVQIMLLIRLK